ncbi:MAG: ABC-F family ATP-binding cassette domain-containing protein [Leptospiraceae bacterium]|nr:ABC-F family ATP-binding cassette domain-containing protein [Leptospiraceae bacterium]
MLNFQNLKPLIVENLFSEIHISIPHKKIICLTGPNGHGKTTLLNAIHYAANKSCKVKILKQAEYSSDPVSAGQDRMRQIEAIFCDSCEIDNSKQQLILLDEPGNFLDANNLQKLLNYLKKNGTYLLVVTHDIRLLEHADIIYYLENGNLHKYTGNYRIMQTIRNSQIESSQRLLNQSLRENRKLKRMQTEIAARQSKRTLRTEKWAKGQSIPKSFVNKCREQAQITAAKLEKSSQRKLQVQKTKTTELKERVRDQGRQFIFKFQDFISGAQLEFENVNLKHENKFLWRYDLNMQVSAGTKIGITGENGTGKTTLLNAIAGQLGSVTGAIKVNGNHFYLDQHIQKIPLYKSCRQWLMESGETNISQMNSLAYQAGFSLSDLDSKLETLSQGEKVRIALLFALLNKPSLLLLDEPTNHLDLLARENLITLLKSYTGTMLVVSHDLDLLNRLELDEWVRLNS